MDFITCTEKVEELIGRLEPLVVFVVFGVEGVESARGFGDEDTSFDSRRRIGI